MLRGALRAHGRGATVAAMKTKPRSRTHRLSVVHVARAAKLAVALTARRDKVVQVCDVLSEALAIGLGALEVEVAK